MKTKLKKGRKRILSILLTLCMLLSVVPMMVSAADAPVDAPLALTYEYSNSINYDNADGNAKMLLDGNINTKWCTTYANQNGFPLTVEFSTDGKTVVKAMELYAANDTAKIPGRNWKSWTLYGKISSAQWIVIESWSNQTPTTIHDQYSKYAISNETAFDYYKLVINANYGDNHTQMADMKLIGHQEVENQTTYTITYNSNGGSTVSSATGKTTIPTLPVPTKSGFEFVGWYTDEALTKVARTGDAISQNTTLYARWGNQTSSLALTYITSNDDAGTFGSNYVPKKLIDGATNTKWCTKKGLPLTFEFSTATNTVVKSMELYAADDTATFPNRNWKSWSLYGLDSTGGWIEIQSWSNQTPNTTYGQYSTYAISNNTSYEKYQLVISASYGPDAQGVTAQMAEMKLNGYNQSYAITYNLNGGTNGDNPATYTYGTGVTSLASATRDGYIFDGWYDAAEDGNKITTIASTATGDKTLYAHWSKDYGTNAKYYKAYDVVVSSEGISFKFLLDQLGHNGNGNDEYKLVRCDMQLRTSNSSTDPSIAFSGNMIDYTKPSKDKDPIGFVKTNADPPQATLDIDRTENIATITIYSENLNISELLTAETPYVWLYIRPCWWKTAYDNSTAQGIAYYNDIVYLGKYSSNENFQNGIEDYAGTVSIDSGITNGTVSVTKATKYEGEKVVLNVKPDTGYMLDTLTYTPTGGTATAITQTDGEYSFTMPNSDVTINASFFSIAKVVKTNSTTTYYTSLSEAISNSESGDTVVMLANCDENITIPQGKDITLDLNGKVLKGTGSGSVITNNGTLTITDSNNTAVHKYVVGSNGLWTWNDDAAGTAIAFENLTARPATNDVIAVKGGAITGGVATGGGVSTSGGGVNNTGTLTMSSGNIVGCKANVGGGVIITGSNPKFTMSGGVIIGCTANSSGGGVAIYGGGTFTMSDTAEISNCFASYVGGGVEISNGSFTMNGGTIADCEVKRSADDYGGGVCNGPGGTFNMNGGTITRCKTSKNNGGGVVSGGKFTMTGGTISDCYAAGDGGGVRVDNTYGFFTMTGGTIENCTSNGNGGGVHIQGTNPAVTLGGSAVITGNKKGSTANNLYLPSGKKVIIDSTTPLAAGSEIGVTTAALPTVEAPVQFTTNGAKNTDVKYFFSDNKAYAVQYNNNGYLMLVVMPEAVKNAKYYCSLTLNDNIDINFAVRNVNLDSAKFDKLEVYANDTLVNGTLNNGHAEYIIANVEPKDMGKNFKIVVMYDGIKVKEINYTAAKYCTQGLTQFSGNQKLCELCYATLYYGKCAQLYTNPSATDLVTNGVANMPTYTSQVGSAELSEEVNNAGKSITNAQVSLTIDSETSMNIILTTKDTYAKEDFKITNDLGENVDPDSVSFESTSTGYTISINDIGASRLSRSYTVKCAKDPGLRIVYSPYNYMQDTQDGENEKLSDLTNAMYIYGQAAQAYYATIA